MKPRHWIVVSVVVIAIVAGSTAWLMRDDRPRAGAGEVVEVRDGSRVLGASTDVLVPTGRLRVTVAEPSQEMPSPCCTDDPAGTRAPEGGSFVGVEVSNDSVLPTTLPETVPGAEVPAPSFTLLVSTGDGSDEQVAEYPIDTFRPAPDDHPYLVRTYRGYVAVDGVPDLDDVSVRVTYDGVAQVVEPGDDQVSSDDDRTRDLNYASVASPKECGEVTATRGVRLLGEPGCSLGVRRTPYVVGVGWAPEGQRWLVVTYSADLYVDVEVGGQVYHLGDSGEEVVLSASIAGVEPHTSWSTGGILPQVGVFPISERSDPVVLSARYPFDERRRGVPRHLTLAWTIS